MTRFQKNTNLSRFLYSKVTIIGFCIFTLFFAYNVTGIIKKSRATTKNLDAALLELDALEAKKTKLQAGIDTLNTEKGVEDTIREKYRVVKEGEGLVVIVNDQNKTGESTQAEEEASKHGFWNFIKNLFRKEE